jgi:hypothetical protein
MSWKDRAEEVKPSWRDNAVELVPEAAPRPEVSTAETIFTPLAQGLTLGYADELYGLGGAVLGKREENEGFWDRYKRFRDEERARVDAIKEESPIWSTTGEIIGGVGSALATGGLALKARGGAALGRAGLAKLGAAEGLAAGAGFSRSDLTEGEVGGVAADAALGGALGAAGPYVLPPALRGAARAVGTPLRGAAVGAAAGALTTDPEELSVGNIAQRAALGGLAGAAVGAGVGAMKIPERLATLSRKLKPEVEKKLTSIQKAATESEAAQLAQQAMRDLPPELAKDLKQSLIDLARGAPLVKKVSEGFKAGLKGEKLFGASGFRTAENIAEESAIKWQNVVKSVLDEENRKLAPMVAGIEVRAQRAGQRLENLIQNERALAQDAMLNETRRLGTEVKNASNLVGKQIGAAYDTLEQTGATIDAGDFVAGLRGELSELVQARGSKKIDEQVRKAIKRVGDYKGQLTVPEMRKLKDELWQYSRDFAGKDGGSESFARLFRKAYGELNDTALNQLEQQSPELFGPTVNNLRRLNNQYSQLAEVQDVMFQKGYDTPTPFVAQLARNFDPNVDMATIAARAGAAENTYLALREAAPEIADGVLENAVQLAVRSQQLGIRNRPITASLKQAVSKGEVPLSGPDVQRQAFEFFQDSQLKASIDTLEELIKSGRLVNPAAEEALKSQRIAQQIAKEYADLKSSGQTQRASNKMIQILTRNEENVNAPLNRDIKEMWLFLNKNKPDVADQFTKDLADISLRYNLAKGMVGGENIGMGSKIFGEMTNRFGKGANIAGLGLNYMKSKLGGTPTGTFLERLIDSSPGQILDFTKELGKMNIPGTNTLRFQLMQASESTHPAQRAAMIRIIAQMPQWKMVFGDNADEQQGLRIEDLDAASLQAGTQIAEEMLEGTNITDPNRLATLSSQMLGSDNERIRRMGNVLRSAASMPDKEREELMNKLMSVQANKAIMDDFLSDRPRDIKARTPKTTNDSKAPKAFDNLPSMDETQAFIDKLTAMPNQTNVTRRLKRILEINKTRNPQQRAAALFAARQHPEFRELLKQLEDKK